jgi:deazaflavin-dependent oxidoreductase (nitroreductase family)
MYELSTQNEEALRQSYKVFNKFMLLLWRLGLGRWFNFWPEVTGKVLVITHKGRKSGTTYRTPVNYTTVDGDVYCTAAMGDDTDWYLNIMENPEVEIWMPDGWWSGVAEDISSSENRTALLRKVLIGSGFAAYLFGVNPNMPVEKLENLTAEYRLVRLHRQEARTGSDGPGDLSWIWPLATFILLPLVFCRRKRR